MEQLNNKIKSQIFYIRLSNQLSDSILDYFTMSVGLFFYGCLYADIIVKDDTKSLFYELILISGIFQIILAIYDWYKGKSLALLSNILFGLLFISWYYKYDLILENDENHKDKQYEGIIYILFLVFTLTMIIAVKNKGKIYSINYLVLMIAFAFMVVDKYDNHQWVQNTFGYAFIVSGVLFWITGTMRVVNSQFLNRRFLLVKE